MKSTLLMTVALTLVSVDAGGVVEARLESAGFESVDCGGGGACLPRTVEAMAGVEQCVSGSSFT